MMSPILRQLSLATAMLVALSACMEPAVPTRLDTDVLGPFPIPEPRDGSQDACLASLEAPVVMETVTELVLIQDVVFNEDGTVLHPAVYGNETREQIAEGPPPIEFETPCPELMTPELISSVQRALQARSYYDGPITGELDAPTTAAINAYQFDENDIDTGILTLRSARALGLIAVPRDSL